MAAVTIRNLPNETHRALKLLAARHGVSTEAEIRAILQEAVRPKTPLLIGTELAAFGKSFGLDDFNPARDPSPVEAAVFE